MVRVVFLSCIYIVFFHNRHVEPEKVKKIGHPGHNR